MDQQGGAGALFGEVATLAEQLAAEPSRLRKRAAIAEAVGRLAGRTSAHTGEGDIADLAERGPGNPADRDVEALAGAATIASQSASQIASRTAKAGRFCLYLAGQPFPEADNRRLNAGGALLSKALKAVSGATDAAMTAAYRQHGDLGAAAFDLLRSPHGRAPDASTLTLDEVATRFDEMAVARTTAARSATVEGLLRRATALEAKYLLKLMLGDMRIGVKQSLIEEGIAVAAGAVVEAVRHAVMLEADLQRAVTRAFAGTLEQAHLRLFHPLGFMLASPVETPAEAVERFTQKPDKPPKVKAAPKRRSRKEVAEAPSLDVNEAIETAESPEGNETVAREAAEDGYAEDVAAEAQLGTATASMGSSDGLIHAFLEDKFDGIRAQVHCGDPAQPGRVAVYSRSREDITESFPEIAEAFASVSAPPDGLILDGEILGWELESARALPFAVLGQRIGRKRVPDDLRRSVPVVFMAFDVMFAEGELQLPRPFAERRSLLERVVPALSAHTFAALTERAPVTDQGVLFGGANAHQVAGPMGSPAGVQRLLLSRAERVESAEAVDQGYRDARARSNEGVMLKAAGSAYLPGRRGLAWLKLKRELATLDVVITGAEYGSGKRAQLLSDYTFAVRGPGGELLNLGKAYQGVTDVEIAELTEWLKEHTLENFGHFRTVEPIRVIEVAFNNVMRSDRHASGFALRFPRILRLRDDKPLSEIDTLARVAEVYSSQPDKPSGDPENAAAEVR